MFDRAVWRTPSRDEDRTWHGVAAPVDYLGAPIWVPRLQRITRLAIGAVLLAAIAYGSFALRPSNRGEWIPYILFAGAEIILLLNAIAIWLTCLADDGDHWETPEVVLFRERLLSGEVVVDVDVLITVYGEPLDVIERTVVAARDMELPHQTWVCDDGRSDEVLAMCQRLGVGYLRRNDRRGVKAGNANRALDKTSAEFVALLDADHVPHPDFLVVLLPHLARQDVAFVQAPQAYRYETGRIVEVGSAESQQLFYEVICPGKSRFNAAFHVGTNAVFRRRALEDVDGFYEDTHSEDIWTSIRLHQRGWRSVYLPHVVAKGLSPQTVNAHFRQQFRWASGSFEILLRSNPMLTRGLTLDQKLQYLTPPLHFLQGFANLWFLLLPPMFLLFGWEPINSNSGTWLTYFLPYWLLTQAVLWLQAGGVKWRPIVLSVATAPVHVRAFFAVLFRRKPVWQATNQNIRPPTVLETTLLQVSLLLLNITGAIAGVIAIENPVGTTICVGLCLLHVVILGTVIREAAIDARSHREPAMPAAISVPESPVLTPATRGALADDHR